MIMATFTPKPQSEHTTNLIVNSPDLSLTFPQSFAHTHSHTRYTPSITSTYFIYVHTNNQYYVAHCAQYVHVIRHTACVLFFKCSHNAITLHGDISMCINIIHSTLSGSNCGRKESRKTSRAKHFVMIDE